jgi:hypothetical protein
VLFGGMVRRLAERPHGARAAMVFTRGPRTVVARPPWDGAGMASWTSTSGRDRIDAFDRRTAGIFPHHPASNLAPVLGQTAHRDTTSTAVVIVAMRPSVCSNTASTYAAGSPATASPGTTTW